MDNLHLFELINKLVAVDGMHDLRPPPAHSGHLCHGYGLAELGITNQCTVAVNDCKRVGNTP